ncbi:hypothetical protein ACFQI7_07555 [Paenibacillus allorhizosphaerae]|uniref:Lipoprotein n=1 Tax=Paenibacillus allorhizosphaerae TaxID=2849866 RepID=A0ABN7TNV5_9BACL|nr:hypothetical protein [Paenibacillus allorhizosphaerae]CAG7637182.1 hypothetical protein PAECIP111802_02329 [Paenibacillus allorhizosphaerae]
MNRKMNGVLIATVCLLALTACRGGPGVTAVSSPAAVQKTVITPAPAEGNASPTAPVPAPVTGEPQKKQDVSVRAIGAHPKGRLIVKPASQASVIPLGAPSCYGQEADLNWSGDYEAVWEAKSGGEPGKIFTFPVDFEIIQPVDTPVELQKFTLGETDIFVYVPRYTDCHALETYLFGVKDGKAFPITYEMEPARVLTNIGQLPNRRLKSNGEELIVTGGYGAGQDFIDVYHFRYDAKKHSMILRSTDKVKPSDLQYDEQNGGLYF